MKSVNCITLSSCFWTSKQFLLSSRTSTILPEHNSRTNPLCRFMKRMVSTCVLILVTGAYARLFCGSICYSWGLFLFPQAGTHHLKRMDKELQLLCTVNTSLGQRILFSTGLFPALWLNRRSIIFLMETIFSGSSDKYSSALLQEGLYSGITQLLPWARRTPRWVSLVFLSDHAHLY